MKMKQMRNQKGFRGRGRKRPFGSGAISVMPKPRLSRKERQRRPKLSRWEAIGLAIGLTVGSGLFATLFLPVPKHSGADSVEEEDIAKSTNYPSAYMRVVHE